MSMVIPLNRVKRNGKVDLWDLGPQVPKGPVAPAEPDDKLKGADRAAAEIEYEDACILYKDSLRAYTAARTAHREWHEQKGGPVKVEFWGYSAFEAMKRDPGRYMVDLPKGAKPGKAQIETERREAAEAEELKRATSMDPHFGSGAGAPAR